MIILQYVRTARVGKVLCVEEPAAEEKATAEENPVTPAFISRGEQTKERASFLDDILDDIRTIIKDVIRSSLYAPIDVLGVLFHILMKILVASFVSLQRHSLAEDTSSTGPSAPILIVFIALQVILCRVFVPATDCWQRFFLSIAGVILSVVFLFIGSQVHDRGKLRVMERRS